MKCSICKENVITTFLGKINGTYEKGKVVCSKCQKKLANSLESKVPQ